MSTKHRDEEDPCWERMLAFENGPFTTNFDQLVKAGLEPPAPETLDDAQLHRTLWKVILALAELRVFIEHTDHLSILGGWSEKDTQLF